MGDPIAIASIILAVGTTLGGLFGYWHLKLKSDCCKCCQLECSEKQQQKRPTISPPMSPIILEKDKIYDDPIKIRNDALYNDVNV
jgi:hypothetical protein